MTGIGADEALERLVEGNRRFASATGQLEASVDAARRLQLVDGQQPIAVILGCADSRVPAEIVFDQGLGDLFVVRVAGNVAGTSQIGSVEFAAERLGTRLVVVLGHSLCGAVAATIDEISEPSRRPSPYLGSIVERVRPSVEAWLGTEAANDREALLRHAVRENVRSSVRSLKEASEVLRRFRESDGLKVVGAEYSLETGRVELLD